MSFKQVNGVTLKEIRAAVTLRRCQAASLSEQQM